jgi:hypothetical protein
LLQGKNKIEKRGKCVEAEKEDVKDRSETDRELSELEQENERLRKENELLKEYKASLPLKERIYDRIPLSVKQMDWIILALLGLLAGVVGLGLLDR